MRVGYIRSTHEGDIAAAENASLRDAGCEVVFADSWVGSAAEQQPELAKALESLQPQDVLLVTKLDRLAGALPELIARMVQVQTKGASVRTLQAADESGAASGRDLLEALLSFDPKLANPRNRSGAKPTPAQADTLERPRQLDDAAARLAESRAHDAEPAAGIARPLGATRKLRRARTRNNASS
jgi:DNA invertase Pin-like site-specific DNA recombinase